MEDILKQIDAYYGIIIEKNNKIIYEKYKKNKKNTRFRIFSLSKPITGLAIVLLAQMKKLKLSDTLNKYCINIPNANKITIKHLLYHSSGVYDFSSKLYFELTPMNLFKTIINKYETEFVDFETTIQEINRNKPMFKPLSNSEHFDNDNYNNTGFDILGYIIYLASGMKSDEFIKQYIFKELKMKDSGFQSDCHPNESVPYETKTKKGIKEQQNWFCGNAYVVCTLRDYLKFMNNYCELLDNKHLKIYENMYWFWKTDDGLEYMTHIGKGDFSHKHANNKESYKPISISGMIKYKDVRIVISENYRKDKGIFTKYEIYNKIIDYVNSCT